MKILLVEFSVTELDCNSFIVFKIYSNITLTQWDLQIWLGSGLKWIVIYFNFLLITKDEYYQLEHPIDAKFHKTIKIKQIIFNKSFWLFFLLIWVQSCKPRCCRRCPRPTRPSQRSWWGQCRWTNQENHPMLKSVLASKD